MFRRLAGDPDNLDHLRRVESHVRQRFALDAAALVLVSEETPVQPGFPARETVVRFWHGGQRYRLRVFKPAARVAVDDMPVSWLLPALVDDGLPDCC